MGDGAADGSPVANLEVADERDCRGHQGNVSGDGGVMFGCGLSDGCPDPEVSVGPLDAVEAPEMVLRSTR